MLGGDVAIGGSDDVLGYIRCRRELRVYAIWFILLNPPESLLVSALAGWSSGTLTSCVTSQR